MAVREEDKLTREQLYNNYEFKLVRRILKDKYPWIKDVIVEDPDKINKYNILFVDIIIDAEQLAQETGGEIMGFVTSSIFFDYFSSPYLSTFFKTEERPSQYSKIQDEIDQTLVSIHTSPALPDTLKLPPNRKLMSGSFKYIKPKKQDTPLT